jgi:hypothetical protein
MLPTIQFDDQAGSLTAKIDDEGADRLLTSKFLTRQLTIAYKAPQQRFGERRFPTELAG